MATRFLKVCAALLCLAVAFHLGAQSITAAPQPTPSGITAVSLGTIPGSPAVVAMASNGDFYVSGTAGQTWTYQGNMFGNPGPTRP